MRISEAYRVFRNWKMKFFQIIQIRITNPAAHILRALKTYLNHLVHKRRGFTKLQTPMDSSYIWKMEKMII